MQHNWYFEICNESALSAAAELCYFDSMVTPASNSLSLMFPQNNYSVTLLVISR